MPSSANDLEYAVTLVRRICELCGEPNLNKDIRASFRKMGLLQAIRRHDSDTIYDWMAEAISYQGISDHVASTYIEQHGSVSAWEIGQGLERNRLCPKLKDYWHFEGCGFQKTQKFCNQPQKYRQCPPAPP